VNIIFEVDETTLELTPGDYARASVQLQDENDDSWSSLEPSAKESAEESADPTAAEESSERVASECRPTIMPLDLPEPLGPKLFIWGEPVLRKYYTVYNWKDQSIGFGLARHASDEKAKVEADSKPKRKPLLL